MPSKHQTPPDTAEDGYHYVWYKENIEEYRTSAYKCFRITESISTFLYFFKDERLMKKTGTRVPVGNQECLRMKLN